jgi:ribosomal protein S12 methylthiotransferase
VQQELTEVPIGTDDASKVLRPRTRIGFVSLGCPKNLVDSEVMMGLLDQAGAEITNRPETADILVVNTCSFIDKAKQESIDTILQMAEHKVSGKARKLIVAGCLVERYRDEITKNMPEVDAVVGTGELEAILAAAGLQAPAPPPDQPQLFSILSSGVAQSVASRAEGDLRESQGRFARETWEGAQPALPQYLYDHTTPRLLATQKSSAYIKIAEGCDHPCSFCVIPNLRGKFRSRRFASVVTEAEQLIAQGVREITLIGQDTTCYGEDLGMKDGLAQLLDTLAQLPNLKWLRFLYAYPNKVTGRLLDTIARHDTICKYLDMPLQHASGPVLKSMRRGGNADIFLKTIERVRASVPGVAIRTTFITGFPGETQADFDVLSDFVRAARLDWLGVFSYSDEEGSGAFHLGDKVPTRTIEARRRSLMRLQQSISRKSRASLIGRNFELLVEGASEETPLLWEGRTEHQAPEIDGKVFINDFGPFEHLDPGRFYQCEITESQDYDLVGRIIAE